MTDNYTPRKAEGFWNIYSDIILTGDSKEDVLQGLMHVWSEMAPEALRGIIAYPPKQTSDGTWTLHIGHYERAEGQWMRVK